MPLISSNSESTTSAIKTRFGYHQNQQSEPSDPCMALVKSSSSPEVLLKSAARDKFFLQSSSYKDKSSKSEDGETAMAANGGARSFEFREDPSFWKEHNVQVIIRIRPLSSSEISIQGNNKCVKQDSSQSITWTGHPESRYTFDLVADENVSQEMLFKVAGVPMVENCMEGYNSCMFAYGQTGSGKTHTMLGDIEGGARRHSVNCGMTPRVFEYLFSRIQRDKDARREEKLKFTCRCSFLEIYNEQIFDLLDPSSTNLQIREDSKKGVYVENLTEIEVTSARDVMQQLIQGASNRKVAATNMNRASSRSHSVFTCVIESKFDSQGVTHHRFARLNLVDLAGSERQKSSGAEGERLKEATNINKSLSTLGLVIMNLVSISNGKSLHVPYRDSKLTFLLQDSLGGNAKTIIIANISPSSCCSLETLSTLKFAQRAKYIKNHAIINEDASGDVLALRLENQNLKKEVSRLRSLVNGGVESHDGDVLSLAFPGSPGSFKWDGLRGLSSPFISEKKMSRLQSKEYEVALVGAFRREKDKDAALQALTEENQAAVQLAKQREDEIQGLKMRLRFREAGIKRLEAVASGKISAEFHLLKEKEEYLKEIDVLRSQVDRNQEVTRFAMENLRLKEEIRRLKSFCEEGERESVAQQITILQNKLLEALDWKLMHESDPANVQKESPSMVMDIQSDDNFLSSNQGSASPWRTSMNEENEFLRIQAIQNQSELDSLRKRLDFCIEEKEKLERHVSDLEKELEAERLSKEVIAAEGHNPETNLPSSVNDHVLNVGQSDQTEIKTMVDAIAAASQREAQAHEMTILLSKENDELRMKLKVLIEDNNKLIDLYERAVAENTKSSQYDSLNSLENSIEDHNHHLAEVAEEKDLEMRTGFESLKRQLAEMHEENDKLLSLYETAMQERDELKRVIASDQRKNTGNKGDFCCPEKLVEIDEGQCLRFDESSSPLGSVGPHVQNDDNDLDLEDHPETITESLLEETSLYDVHVQDGYDQSLVDSRTSNYSDSTEPTAEDGMEINELKEPEEQKESNGLIEDTNPIAGIDLEMQEKSPVRIPADVYKDLSALRKKLVEEDKLKKPEEENGLIENMNPTEGTNLEMQKKSLVSIPADVYKDLNALRKKLVDAQQKLCYSAKALSTFSSLEKAIIDFDTLSEEIGKMESGIRSKQQECANLKSLSSELQARKDLAKKKLSALKHSLKTFSSSICYFEQREALARSRLNASSQELIQRKEELTNLQVSMKGVMDSLLKLKQIETELRNSLENLKSKVEEENKKLESDRVLFAIDNVEKTNWNVSGKATELLKSEEEKTKLQNQIKQHKERLGEVKKEAEAVNTRLSKMENEIRALEMETQKEAMSVQEMERKLQSIVREKEMLLEVKENGKNDFDNMIIEYYQSVFEADLKEEEMKVFDDELVAGTRKVEGLRRTKDEATMRMRELVEAMTFNSRLEADLHDVQRSVAELNSLLENCGSVNC